MTCVKLKEPRGREEIISALERAAEDMGFTVGKADSSHEEYRLGSVEKVSILDRTRIGIARSVGEKALLFYSDVGVYEHFRGGILHFDIQQLSACDDDTLESYLSKVSEYLG